MQELLTRPQVPDTLNQPFGSVYDAQLLPRVDFDGPSVDLALMPHDPSHSAEALGIGKLAEAADRFATITANAVRIGAPIIRDLWSAAKADAADLGFDAKGLVQKTQEHIKDEQRATLREAARVAIIDFNVKQEAARLLGARHVAQRTQELIDETDEKAAKKNRSDFALAA